MSTFQRALIPFTIFVSLDLLQIVIWHIKCLLILKTWPLAFLMQHGSHLYSFHFYSSWLQLAQPLRELQNYRSCPVFVLYGDIV